MLEWSLQFFYNKSLDEIFIKNFFDYLISKGLKDSAGSLSIISHNPEKYIRYDYKEAHESFKNLSDEINFYIARYINNSFSVNVGYEGEVEFFFRLGVYVEELKKCLITFETDEDDTSEDAFLAFVYLCRDVFERFDFVFGGFRGEPPDTVPLDGDEFLKCVPRNVAFYSKPLVDKIGREKLLSAPAYQVEELRNGGVMLLVCPEPRFCADEEYKIDRYLGYRYD